LIFFSSLSNPSARVLCPTSVPLLYRYLGNLRGQSTAQAMSGVDELGTRI
jgi:hypothetical protein